MSDAQNLHQALIEWRRGVESARAEAGEVKTKNPYGQQIYELNMNWATTLKAHEDLISAERDAYKEKLAELTELSTQWKNEYGAPNAPAGRPKNPDYSDEVKMAAAQAIREGETKTLVRVVMGINHTPTLNRVLTEGEALLKAQEGAEW